MWIYDSGSTVDSLLDTPTAERWVAEVEAAGFAVTMPAGDARLEILNPSGSLVATLYPL